MIIKNVMYCDGIHLTRRLSTNPCSSCKSVSPIPRKNTISPGIVLSSKNYTILQ